MCRWLRPRVCPTWKSSRLLSQDPHLPGILFLVCWRKAWVTTLFCPWREKSSCPLQGQSQDHLSLTLCHNCSHLKDLGENLMLWFALVSWIEPETWNTFLFLKVWSSLPSQALCPSHLVASPRGLACKGTMNLAQTKCTHFLSTSYPSVSSELLMGPRDSPSGCILWSVVGKLNKAECSPNTAAVTWTRWHVAWR